jgi:hypothetical protein
MDAFFSGACNFSKRSDRTSSEREAYKMKAGGLFCLFVLAMAAGPVATDDAPPKGKPGEVRWSGEQRKVVQDGDLTGRVDLTALAERPHLYAPHNPEEHAKVKVPVVLESRAVDVIGFYSKLHTGIFTHHDSYAHMHVVTADKKVSGHVDQLSAGGEMRLYLPAIVNSRR